MAKFIFVASADAQDIAASTFAVQRIQHMFDLKLDVSRFLAKIEKGGNNDFNNEIISDEDRKRFMIRLLDAGRIIKKVQKTGTSDNETNVEKQANPNERIELRPLLWYVRGVHAGFEFNISFSKLVWSVLFNRIPKLLKDDEYQTVLEALFPKIAADDSDDLETIQGQVKLCFDQNSVVYNDKYALQFLLPMFFEKSMALPKRSKSKMPAWSDEQLSETTKDCNFESGEMLLEFLRETHECFQYHAKILEKPTGSRISINWLEFSPLWLFAQQKKTGTWHKELEELSNIPGNIEMGDQLREIYNRRLEQYRGERLADDCLTWIEEAYLAAITLKEWLTMGHLDFNMRKTEIDIRNLKWLRTVLTFSKAVEIGSTDNWPRKKISFNETIFKEECYGEVPLSNNIRILREIFYNQAVFYRAKNVFLKFIQSYNYLLRTADSLRLINATAKYSYVEQYNNLYQVFAESLFHHVLHVRDVSLDEASGYLRIAGEQAQDSETMVKMFFEFKAMNEMVGVVENIIGKNGWGLVDKIGGLDDI